MMSLHIPSRKLVPLVLLSASVHGCSSKRRARDDAPRAQIVEAMARVPAGWVSLGCYRLLASSEAENAAYNSPFHNSFDDERMLSCVISEPPRRVWVSSFEIDRYEVTQGEYELCLEARVCERRPPALWEKIYGGPELPAIATHDDATRFCNWLGKRLPTNAEWEKAARGTDDRIYPWGDAPPTCEHVAEGDLKRDGFRMSRCPGVTQVRPRHSHPAGASPYGVEDLLGNAKEWVSDWYAGSMADPKSRRLKVYINEPVEGEGLRLSYSKNTAGPYPVLEYDWDSIVWAWKDPALVDPQGPPEPDGPGVPMHVIKGDELGIAGSSERGEDRDDTHREYAGFRCARSIPGPSPPDVQSPRPGELTLPYREAGYTPPGTPSAPASGTPEKATKNTPAIKARKKS